MVGRKQDEDLHVRPGEGAGEETADPAGAEEGMAHGWRRYPDTLV